MQIERLYYFKAAAQHSSLTKASQQCNVTQQAVSIAVKELETILNTTLFVRQKSGIQLTAKGMKVYEKVTEILKIWESLIHSSQIPVENSINATLKIIFTTTLSFMTPEIIQKFSTLYPNINILIEENFLNSLPDDENASDIIIYLIGKEQYTPKLLTAHDHYHQEVLSLDTGAIMVGQNSPYAKYKLLPKKAFTNWSWIFFNNKLLPEISLLNGIFENSLPATYINTNNYNTYINAVIEQNYAALTTNIIKKSAYYRNKQIHLIQLRQKVYGYYILAVKKETLQYPFMKDLLNILREIIHL